MASTAIHLDWRNAPDSGEVVDRIFALLTEIDQNSRGKIILSGSMTGVKGAELKHVGGNGNIIEDDSTEPSTRMFVFEKKTTTKRALDYLLKLAVVAERILQDIDKGVPVPQRLFGFYWTHKSLTRELAHSIAVDIALTIDVHPYNLGLVPEVDGRFALPRGWTIRFQVCENILDRDASGSLKLAVRSVSGPSADAAVPSLIHSLEVRRGRNVAGPIRAVLVFEHRNIKFMFNSLVRKEDLRFKDIIFISATKLRHFFNHRNFSSVHEPQLYADLIAMGMNPLGSRTAINPNALGEKFGLAKLCQFDNFGIERCVANIMTDMSVVDVGSTAIGSEATLSLKRAWADSGLSLDPATLKRVRTEVDFARLSTGTDEAMEESVTTEDLASESESIELTEDQIWAWEAVNTALDYVRMK